MITIDTSEFEQALRETLLHTSRDAARVINGAAIDVLTTAAKLTPKADKAAIAASLKRQTSSISVARVQSNRIRRKHLHSMKIFNKPPLLLWMILNSRQKKALGSGHGFNNADMIAAEEKFIRQRVRSIGFNAYAGWQKALLAVGGKGFGRGRPRKGFEASSAAGGRGKAATVADLLARMSNTAAWIEHIGAEPLNESLNLVAARLTTHLEEKLAEHCKAASR